MCIYSDTSPTLICQGPVCVSASKPPGSSSQTMFLSQYCMSSSNPSLRESQQCKWLLMGCNGSTVWAVYCCFDKLFMTCVHSQNAQQQNALRKSDDGRKWWKTAKWKADGVIHLPLIIHKNTPKEGRAGGEGAVISRWHQWCHLMMRCLTPEQKKQQKNNTLSLSCLRHGCSNSFECHTMNSTSTTPPIRQLFTSWNKGRTGDLYGGIPTGHKGWKHRKRQCLLSWDKTVTFLM